MKKHYLNYLAILFALFSVAITNGQICTTPGASSTVIFLEEFDNNSAGWTGDIGNSNQDWEIPDASGSSNTGADNAHSGSNYMNYEASYNYTPDQGSIVSPAIDLTGALDAVELSFWMYAYGANMGTFDLGVGTSASGPFTNEYTHVGQIQTSGSQPWVNVTVDLTGYLGSTIYIELTQTDLSGYYGDMSIDAFQVSACVGCAKPTSLSTASITSSSASFAWIDASASSWQVSYGAPGFTAGNGDQEVTTNPYSATGLNAGTDYDWYVRSICAPGDTSGWAGPNSFSTLCGVITAPYTQNFDGSTTTPNCWDNSFGSEPWSFAVSGAGNPYTPLSGAYDHTNNMNGVGNYAWIDASSSIGTNALVTPDIDISGLAAVEVGYWLLSNNTATSSNNTIVLSYWDGSSWQVLNTYSGDDASWVEIKEVVPVTAPAVTRFRLVQSGTYYQNDLLVDDFFVQAAPTCLVPTSLGVGTITSSTTIVNWTSSESNFDVGFGPAPFAEPTAPNVGYDNVANGVTLTGLSDLTNYQYWVRADCDGAAGTDESIWAGPFDFTTPISPLTCALGTGVTDIFSTSFESSCSFNNDFSALLGWSNTSTGNGSWRLDCDNSSTPTGWVDAGAYDGSDYVFFESSSVSANTSDTITTTDFDISSLTSSGRATGYYLNGGSSTFIVERSVDAGLSWTNVLTNVGPGGTTTDDLGPWTLFQDDFSAVTGSASTIRWRFIGVASGNNSGDIGFDLFTIEACVSCVPPTALGVGAITATSAVVNWTSSETDFDVAFGLAPFTNPGTPTGIYDNVANGVMLTGLTSATNYEYYVRADCDAGAGTDESTWTGPFAFSTPCATYVAPYTQNFDGLIVNFPYSDLPSCWEDQSSQQDLWKVTDDNLNNPLYLPNYGDHTTGSSNYMWVDASVSYSLNIAANEMVSPPIDISGLTTPYAGFWFASNLAGSNHHTISFDVWDGSAWVNITTLSGSFSGWVEIASELPAGIPAITKFRIQAINNPSAGTSNDLGVDDFFVIEKPINQWTGNTNTDWHTATNWSFGTVPTNSEAVGIPDVSSASGNFPVTSSDIIVTNLTVDAGATLDIGAGAGLTIAASGAITNNGGIVLNADASGAAWLDDFTNASATYTGVITVQQFVTPGSGLGQRMFGSPVNSGVVSGLSPTYASGSTGQIVMSNCASLNVDAGSPYNNLFEWREHLSSPNSCAFESWYAITQSTTLDNGRGYSGWMQDGTIFSFTAAPNTGNISYGGSLSNSVSGLPNKDGWHVLSNPYPSPANVNALTSGNWNSLQTYDPSQAYAGTFQPITAGQDLAIAQGFVAFTSVDNNTANFTNTMRSPNSIGFKSNDNWFISKLNIEVQGNGFKDISYIYFNDDATFGFDNQWDCKKKASDAGQPTLFTLISGEKSSLNGHAIDELGENSIPLGMSPGANGQFSFEVTGLNSFPPSTLVYLEDKVTGDFVNLRETNSYSFSMTEMESEDRFEIHFTKPITHSHTAETCAGDDGLIAIDFGSQSIVGNLISWDYELLLNNQVVISSSESDMAEISDLEPGDYELILTNGTTVVSEWINIADKLQVEAAFIPNTTTLYTGDELIVTNNSIDATDYVWELNGEIFTSVDLNYTFTTPGTYVLSLHASNVDCDAYYEQTLEVSEKTTNPTGIANQIALDEAIVFANGKTITVDLSKVELNGQTDLAIYNLVGKLVFEKLNITDFEVVNIDRAASGIYLVNIINKSESISKKVILK